MNDFQAGWRDILLIEDDHRQFECVSDFLQPNGFKVHGLAEGQSPLEGISAIRPHAVLLDVMLPGEKNGFDILREIRAASNVPVIMVTARGSEIDRVVGLEMGADDYLPKPFNPHELLARIRALLRRHGAGYAPAGNVEKKPERRLHSGEFELDFVLGELCRRGEKAKLTSAETAILKALMEHPNEALDRDVLLQLAFGDGYSAIDRIIDVHVSRLRAAIRKLGAGNEPIRTVRRAGYCWVADDE